MPSLGFFRLCAGMDCSFVRVAESNRDKRKEPPEMEGSLHIKFEMKDLFSLVCSVWIVSRITHTTHIFEGSI